VRANGSDLGHLSQRRAIRRGHNHQVRDRGTGVRAASGAAKGV
jgi:hypothetical protein